ncbi:tetratricopeptide repeat protein [Rhodohalobacter sp. 8-1]|uniref:tetratricopeptide repeat protein n=1 Tax=Rhodohalobacter sp. 8-1 TaxID=3131972 RepID=UPI0030EEBE01
MKSYSKILPALLLFAMILGFTQQVAAQEEARGEAVTLYNQAQELAGAGELEDAIATYRDALEVAENNELQDISERIRANIARVYYTRASRSFQQFQQQKSLDAVNQAIEYFEDAQEAGREFNDDQVVQQTSRALPQLHYLKSTIQFRNESYDAAMASLDTAIELNPNYPTAHYQRAIVYKKQNPNDNEKTFEYYDRAIELAEQLGDNRTLNNARTGAAEELIYRANNLKENDNYSEAIELLNRVSKYDSDNSDAHYRLAEVHNLMGNYNNAIQHANQALEYETGGVTARAKIYFELGTAYKGLDQTGNACSAFENANYGEFSDPASHELEFVLECEGYSSNRR